MTIAENLYRTDPDTLFEIIIRYKLERLGRMYFPNKFESIWDIKEDYTKEEYERLMQSNSYSGRVERKGRAVRQPYRKVIK